MDAALPGRHRDLPDVVSKHKLMEGVSMGEVLLQTRRTRLLRFSASGKVSAGLTPMRSEQLVKQRTGAVKSRSHFYGFGYVAP